MLRIKKKTETLKVVVPFDPAIDLNKSDMKGYLETLDIDLLKYKPGKNPSVIHITSMSRWVMAKLVKLNLQDANSYNLSAFRFGIEKIVNLKEHLLSIDAFIDGGTGNWAPEDVVEGPYNSMIPCFSEEYAIEFFNSEFRNFVAGVVQARSNLHRGKTKPYAQSLSSFLVIYGNKA